MSSINQLRANIDSTSAWFIIITASGLLIYWTVISTQKVEAITVIINNSNTRTQEILR